MTVRFTVRCPKLAQFTAKGISPDELKTLNQSQIKQQTEINEKFNARGKELGDILITKLKDCDITWMKDGHLVVSCDNILAEVEQVISEEGLEIKPDRSEIKHKVKQISETESAEDIDEVFEPRTADEKKKLKSRDVTNEYKTRVLQ